ncbi:hypothetical protein [Streptomyces pseudogriseolus]|uniref:hypothetical protein n=1 Tax=Streptomyces pseudogriseolus TaxID=36817 RepID=UPI003FA236A4
MTGTDLVGYLKKLDFNAHPSKWNGEKENTAASHRVYDAVAPAIDKIEAATSPDDPEPQIIIDDTIRTKSSSAALFTVRAVVRQAVRALPPTLPRGMSLRAGTSGAAGAASVPQQGGNTVRRSDRRQDLGEGVPAQNSGAQQERQRAR